MTNKTITLTELLKTTEGPLILPQHAITQEMARIGQLNDAVQMKEFIDAYIDRVKRLHNAEPTAQTMLQLRKSFDGMAKTADQFLETCSIPISITSAANTSIEPGKVAKLYREATGYTPKTVPIRSEHNTIRKFQTQHGGILETDIPDIVDVIASPSQNLLRLCGAIKNLASGELIDVAYHTTKGGDCDSELPEEGFVVHLQRGTFDYNRFFRTHVELDPDKILIFGDHMAQALKGLGVSVRVSFGAGKPILLSKLDQKLGHVGIDKSGPKILQVYADKVPRVLNRDRFDFTLIRAITDEIKRSFAKLEQW